VLRLQGSMAVADGLIEVTLRAELQDQIDVGIGLEGIDEIDNVAVLAQAAVQEELLRLIVDGEVQPGVTRGRPLGETLESDGLVGQEVVSLEDHAEGAVVEWRDGLVASMEKDASGELVSQAFHGTERKRIGRKTSSKSDCTDDAGIFAGITPLYRGRLTYSCGDV